MKYKINLANRKIEQPLDRVIYFALNYLRYILIITQIVVIGVFFYRFKVDQLIVDLEDSIEQKKEIILVSQPLLLQAKNSSFKLASSAAIIADQNISLAATNYILSLFPEKFFLQRLNIVKDTITMTGTTQDMESIQQFLNRMKKEGKFKTVSLTSIEKKEGGLIFSFEFKTFTTPPNI